MNPNQYLVGFGTAGALISAISAAVVFALRTRARERLAAIKGASEDDRARLVADAIVMFKIPVDSLTKEQRYDLVVRQLEDRERQRQRSFFLALVLMFILSGTTIALAFRDTTFNAAKPSVAPPHSSSPSSITQSAGDHGANILGHDNTVQTH